ncbi:unnamed protein product, partial [Symbiodinium sp. CCMP2456]
GRNQWVSPVALNPEQEARYQAFIRARTTAAHKPRQGKGHLPKRMMPRPQRHRGVPPQPRREAATVAAAAVEEEEVVFEEESEEETTSDSSPKAGPAQALQPGDTEAEESPAQAK